MSAQLFSSVTADAGIIGGNHDCKLGNAVFDKVKFALVQGEGGHAQTGAGNIFQTGAFGKADFHIVNDDSVVVGGFLTEREPHVDIFNTGKGRNLKAHFHIFPFSRFGSFEEDSAAAHEFVAVAENTVAHTQRSNTADTFDFCPQDQIFACKSPGVIAENVEVFSHNGVLFALGFSAVNGESRGFFGKDIGGFLDALKPLHLGLQVHGDFLCRKG